MNLGPLYLLIALLVTLGSLILARYVFNKWMAWEANQMLKEFEQRFPGKCPVCSYHRYGIIEGYESPDSKPLPHLCIHDPTTPP